MSAQEPPAVPIRRDEQPSMRDLLASCAAANAVSTPPGAAGAEEAGEEAGDGAPQERARRARQRPTAPVTPPTRDAA
ncbi:hypothetical protein [Streptomyces pactum]|uniref:hypothetical protein n=1 Tax=Streptomyces pactum TaxID=68249 RepID=UPI0036F973B7